MNTPSPLTPQGTTPDTRRRHMTAFFVILSLHVMVLAGFLMLQGCKPETEQPKPLTDANAPGPVTDPNAAGAPAGGPSTLGEPVVGNPAANPVGGPGAGATPPAGVPPGAAPLGGAHDPSATAGTIPTPTTGAGVGGPGGVGSVQPLPPPVLPPPVAADPAPVTTPGTEHTVLRGETLAVIAKKYHMGWKAIAAANPGLDPTKLKIGQKLVIPSRTVTSATDSGASGLGSAPAPTGTTDSAPAPASSKTYTVRSGDNLAKIAKNHGVSLKALKAANGLKLDRITVGQKLKVPSKAGAATASPVVPVATPVIPEPAPTLPAPPSIPAPLSPPTAPPVTGGAGRVP